MDATQTPGISRVARWARLALLILPFAGIAFVAWRILPAPAPDDTAATPGTSAGLDDFGDPLPAFAVRRFGSTRLRPGDGPVALSPDGTKMYSGHSDGLVRVWDVASGQVERTIVAHPDYVAPRVRTLREAWYRTIYRQPTGPERVGSIVVSPDGTQIATCASGSIRVFDAATGVRRADWTASGLADVYGFSADGSRLLIFDRDLCLWTLGADHPMPLGFGKSSSSGMTRVSADGRVAVTMQSDDENESHMSLIDCDTGSVRTLRTANFVGVVPSPVEPRRIAGFTLQWDDPPAPPPGPSESRRAFRALFTIVRADDEQPTVEMDLPSPMGGIAWSADGSAVIVACRSGLVRVDARTGELRTVRDGRWEFVDAKRRSDRVLAWHDRALRVVELGSGAETPTTRPGDAVSAFAWSPKSAVLALGRGDGTVVVARPEDGAVTYGPVASGIDWIWSFQFDASGAALGFQPNQSSTILDLSAPIGGGVPDRKTFHPAVSHWNDTKVVVDGAPVWWVITENQSVELVRGSDGAHLAVEGATDSVSPRFSGDGLSAFGFTGPRGIVVWDVRTGKRRADLPFEGGSCVSAISMNGRHIVCRLGDDVTVFDVATPDAPVVLAASVFPRFASELAISPDGHLLAAGDDRGQVHVVSVPLRKCVATFEGHLGAVRRVEFSSDGRWLASLGEDRTVVVWDVAAADAMIRR